MSWLTAAWLGVPNWLLLVLLIIVALYYYGTRNLSYFKHLNVPHPPAYPWIGNYASLLSEGFTVDRKLVAKYGNVFGYFEGQTPVLVIAEPELIKQVTIKQFSHFINRRTDAFPMNKEFEKALFTLHDAEWKGVRSVITPTFSASKMKRITPLIVDCAKEFVKAVGSTIDQGKHEVEMKGASGCFSMDVIARTQFGTKVHSQTEGTSNQFVRHARRVFEGFSITNPIFIISLIFPFMRGIFERLGYGIIDSKALAFFQKIVYGIIDMRQGLKEKPIDFLQLMLEAHNMEVETVEDEAISYQDSTTETNEQILDWRVGKRALSKHEILSNAIVFFTAGYETTATAMTWVFYLLALNPDCQEKLHEEIVTALEKNDGKISYGMIARMEYLDQVICESLRMYPPAQRNDRVCLETTSVGKYHIPKGLIINISIWGVHHNPQFWPQPDKFQPERFSAENKDKIVPYSYIPFGSGPRNCVGMRLALLEAKIGVVSLIKDFKLSKSQNTEIPPKIRTSGLTIPLNGMPLQAVRR